MEYSIYNILNEYVSYYGKNIIITFENFDNIDFYFDKKTFAHLMGLQYCRYKKNKAFLFAEEIINNKYSDNNIYNTLNRHKYLELSSFANRTNSIAPFLKNVENANLVILDKSNNSHLESIYVLLEIDNKHFLELGVGQTENDQYYLETFLVRNNDNNIDYSLNSKVLSIETYENDELKYFSFDSEKQAKLDEVENIDKNYDYHEALNKSIEEIKNDKQSIKNFEKEYLNMKEERKQENASNGFNNTESNNSNTTKDYSVSQQAKTNEEFNKYNQKLKDDFDNYQNMYEKGFEKFNQSFNNKEK